MKPLTTILTACLLVIASCAMSVLAEAQVYDPTGTVELFGGNTLDNRSPQDRNNDYRNYQEQRNNPQNRYDWSSGQPHNPSSQWTPPAPSTRDFNVWDMPSGTHRLCTSDSRGNVFCQ
jgi:hypothetical protein